MSVYIIIAAAFLAGAAVLAGVAIATGKRKDSRGKGVAGDGSRMSAALVALYSAIIRNPVTKGMMFNIRKRLEFYSDFDERSVRKKSVIVFLITASSFIGLLLVFWVMTRDALMLMIFTLILSLMTDTVVDIFVSNIHIRLMKQQLLYHELLRHKYYELKSVEDANYEACNELNRLGRHEIYIQAERINDILSSADMETNLERYYDTAPNKYLKLLAGMIYITKEYGDTKKDGCSVFVRGIGYLSSEIRADIFKREKLKFSLRSLNVISLLPVFLVKPMRQWAGTSFSPLENFYSSRAGIILGIVTILAAFVSYLTLRRIQRFDRSERAAAGKKSMEDRIYQKWLYRLVDRLLPGEYTKKRVRIEDIIKGSVARTDIRILYTRRIIVGMVCFILGIALFIGLNINNAYRILNVPETPRGYLGGKLSDAEYTKLKELTDFDRAIIEKAGKEPDPDKIHSLLEKAGIFDETARNIAAARIAGKMARLSDCYFKWYELLLCILLFVAGYNAPVLNLRFLGSVRKIDMEEEVAQFQTIILMLKDMGRIHVEEILEWLELFSVQFKGPIQKCLANFSSGHAEALEQLKNDVAFQPMIGLIENLQLANEELGVDRAFEELENEMAHNQEKRKELNEHIVESKRNLGNMIGFLPVYALITLYLMVPMIITGLESVSAFYEQISGF